MVKGRDENNRVLLEQKNKFCVNDTIEIMKPDGQNIPAKVLGIYADDGSAQESAPHSKQQLHLELSEQPEEMDILRQPM